MDFVRTLLFHEERLVRRECTEERQVPGKESDRVFLLAAPRMERTGVIGLI